MYLSSPLYPSIHPSIHLRNIFWRLIINQNWLGFGKQSWKEPDEVPGLSEMHFSGLRAPSESVSVSPSRDKQSTWPRIDVFKMFIKEWLGNWHLRKMKSQLWLHFLSAISGTGPWLGAALLRYAGGQKSELLILRILEPPCSGYCTKSFFQVSTEGKGRPLERCRPSDNGLHINCSM